jgi:hypothetical protein
MPRKSSKRKGGKERDKAGNTGRDPVTGRTVEFLQDGRLVELQDDVVYEVTRGSPDTFADNIYTPLKQIPITPPRDGTYYFQVQLGDNHLIANSYGGEWEYNDSVSFRNVDVGSFSFSKGESMSEARIVSSGMMQVATTDQDQLFGTITEFTPSLSSVTPLAIPIGGPSPTAIVTADYCYLCSEKEKGGGLAAIRAFGGGKYFFEGWQNNLFDTSLV